MAQASLAQSPSIPPHLVLLDAGVNHDFTAPAKKINESEDVGFFLTSKAYGDILAWILQLNASMFPRQTGSTIQTWQNDTDSVSSPPPVQHIATLLAQLGDAIEEAPPDTGPRRFGNVSFRKWYNLIDGRVDGLLSTCLESATTPLLAGDARIELRAYLMGGFGSAQRLDYGTGHELSFLAFLGGLWKLGFFGASTNIGEAERSIVLHAVEPYMALVRKLILTYNLEPAGTHGVWGLDDHAFAPYIFGSAQLGPAITDASNIPQEGSLATAPDPSDIIKANVVERERRRNMYFGAIGFIYDVKKGPFWEHSPMLFDISGVQAGWAKINKGMIKMYIAEVLSKFPVVQHFPFGHLFQWERDPDAVLPTSFTNRQTQTQSRSSTTTTLPTTIAGFMPATAAPWSKKPTQDGKVSEAQRSTAAPWARVASALPSARGPAHTSRTAVGQGQPQPEEQAQVSGTVVTKAAGGADIAVTRAPWAK